MKEKNQNKFIFKVLKVLYYIVIVFACLIIFLILYYMISSQLNSNNENYRPKFSMYTIVSPSMTPVINVYDVVLNIHPSSPEKVEVGDIITYISKSPNSEGMTITHRVVQINTNSDGTYEYITQGDNNPNADSLAVSYDDIIGKELIIIPKLGKVQFLIANKKSWLILLLIPIIIYLIKDIKRLLDLFGLRKKVDKVAGFVETSILDRKKVEEQLRKEQIKESLRKKQSLKESLVKSSNEPKGFLEKYNETIISVKENKYLEKSEVLTDETEIIIKPRQRNSEVKNKQLDNNLTLKIEEYDRKIEELDKMLQDVEKINRTKEEQKIDSEKNDDDFLKEKKIKVIASEPTKNQKKSREVIKKVTPSKEKIEEPKIQNETNELKKNLTTNSKKLNLNPNEIKKVNRKSKTGTIKPVESNTTHPKAKKKLKSKKKQKKSIIYIKKI